jgi:Spy/CpxP family protein refolding chaperone
MDIVTHNRILTRLVVFMVVLNLGLVSYFAIFQPSPMKEFDVDEAFDQLKLKLNLSPEQVREFKDIRMSFFKDERKLMHTIRLQRDSMNAEMFKKHTDDYTVKTLAKNISDNILEMEMLRFEQSKELKEKCTPEQLDKFEALVISLRDYLKPESRPGPR